MNVRERLPRGYAIPTRSSSGALYHAGSAGEVEVRGSQVGCGGEGVAREVRVDPRGQGVGRADCRLMRPTCWMRHFILWGRLGAHKMLPIMGTCWFLILGIYSLYW